MPLSHLLIVLHINVQPFKRTAVSWYSSVDPIFLLLICIMYTSIFGSNIESTLEHTYLSLMVLLGLLTAFFPDHLHHVSYMSLDLLTKAMGNSL